MNVPQNQGATGVSWQSVLRSSTANPAENYERFFVPAIAAPLAADLLNKAALQSGERVLDVACGTGLVARLAAERVGDSGAVAGVDVNPAMIAVARSAPQSDGAIQWHEASAESMPLPDESFDVALCQLGLQFVPDKAAAMNEIRRVLVPGGRLILNLPGPIPPLFKILEEGVGQHLGREPAGFVGMVFSLGDSGMVQNLLNEAGFRDVTVEHESKMLSLPAPAEFLWQYLLSTPLAAAVAQVGDETRTALENEIAEKWGKFASDDGMRYEQLVITATARK